ncbi:type II CRISPR-associated endonuclease Cas1 [Cetobacterium sp.]|uniref:type II CRISPR-associated endonuclease Cas1 n=1 Tax=Cetobacterium sp. TaxID=2071632 RepID=UPI003F2AEAE6
MSWRTVYITQCEKISLYLDNLLIIKDSTEYKIPLKDIGSIVVEDYKAIFTMKILNKFIEYNILLITCDEKHNPFGVLNSIGHHSRQYKIVSNQIKWDEIQKNYIWKSIIKRKIENQREIMKVLNCDEYMITKMTEYIEGVEIGDITNREGIAAGIYFRNIFGDKFRRKTGDGVQNSALNYGYTILTSKVARVISAKGLIPYLGIHHKNEYNQFNLASDLVEVFRPVVDYYVAKYLQECSYFAKEDRVELLNLLNAKIMYCGKKEFLSNCIEKFVDAIINYFETGVEIEDKIPSLIGLELYEL